MYPPDEHDCSPVTDGAYQDGYRAGKAESAAEIARLREALAPFAREVGEYLPVDADSNLTGKGRITVGDLRRARATLGAKP